MADPKTVVPIAPLDAESATASTPLRRVAGRMQAALPPAWHVEIVDVPTGQGGDGSPILRLFTRTD